jgi:Raf kinase inhibitor-like YbhB/YbcL family protein
MRALLMIASLLLAAASSPGLSQESRLAKEVLAVQDLPRFSVTSQAFSNGGPIPTRHSDYDFNYSPPIAWQGAPPATQSFALLMEDAEGSDAAEERPFVHWIAYDILPIVYALPEGVVQQVSLDAPPGMMQGVNSVGMTGYAGPMPPIGGEPHHYHIQMFALDRTLDLPPNAGRPQVLEAMRGHVLAFGELEGQFQAKPGALTSEP